MVFLSNVVFKFAIGGDVMFYDDAVFTPGTYSGGSGSREVTIELTKNGSSIESGSGWILLGLAETDDFATEMFINTQFTISNPDQVAGMVSYPSEVDYMEHCLIAVTSDGSSVEITFTINNSGSEASCYVALFLPDGTLILSDAITIPEIVMPG